MDLTRHCFYRFDISCRVFCTAYPSTERQDAFPCSGTLTRSFNCTSSAMTRAQQVSLRNEPPIQRKLREKLAVGSSRMPNCSGGPTHRLVTRSLENSQSLRRVHGRAIYSMHPRAVWQEPGGGGKVKFTSVQFVGDNRIPRPLRSMIMAVVAFRQSYTSLLSQN